MDEILISELEKELRSHYDEVDAKQLMVHITNYFKIDLAMDEKQTIVDDILEMDFRNED